MSLKDQFSKFTKREILFIYKIIVQVYSHSSHHSRNQIGAAGAAALVEGLQGLVNLHNLWLLWVCEKTWLTKRPWKEKGEAVQDVSVCARAWWGVMCEDIWSFCFRLLCTSTVAHMSLCVQSCAIYYFACVWLSILMICISHSVPYHSLCERLTQSSLFHPFLSHSSWS